MTLYQHTIDGCFEQIIGDSGIAKAPFDKLLAHISPVLKNLKRTQVDGTLPLLSIHTKTDDLAAIEATKTHIHQHFDALVVLGTGGSTLNPQAMVALTRLFKGGIPVHFLDSIDPDTHNALLESLNLKKTAFLATSKSGSTVETITQTLVCLDRLRKAGVTNVGKHFTIISDPGTNPLRTLADELGACVLDHEPGIGGRFSGLTNVGLLPAAVAGLQIEQFRQGAGETLTSAFDVATSQPARGAALALAAIDKGYTSTVMMPYIDRLSAFTVWYCQIWAESLGKQGKGTTPIKALGTIDQHSQLQLYLDGPRDKLFTLITLATDGQGAKLDTSLLKDSGLSYLHGRTVGDINAAAQAGTLKTLLANNRPVRHIHLPALDEKVLGALMMHFMLETIITANILDINAFDQPAVEHGKALAREILSKK